MLMCPLMPLCFKQNEKFSGNIAFGGKHRGPPLNIFNQIFWITEFHFKCNPTPLQPNFEKVREYISGKEVFFFWGLTSITLKKISKEFWYQTIVDNICWKFATIIMHLVKGILKKSIFSFSMSIFVPFGWSKIKKNIKNL